MKCKSYNYKVFYSMLALTFFFFHDCYTTKLNI